MNQTERKKIIEQHKSLIISELDLMKRIIHKLGSIQEKGKEIGKNLGDAIESKETQLKTVSYTIPKVMELSSSDWLQYMQIVSDEETYHQILSNLNSEIIDIDYSASMAFATTGATGASSESDSNITYSLFKPVILPENREEIEKELRDSLTNNTRKIRAELGKIDPIREGEFYELVKSWSISSSLDKPHLLIELRSIIFDRLFNSQYPHDTFPFSKESWYEASPKFKRSARYNQPKKFMLQNLDHTKIAVHTMLEINTISQGLQKKFNLMSEFGKKKNNLPNTNPDMIFEETISLFAQALIIRHTLSLI